MIIVTFSDPNQNLVYLALDRETLAAKLAAYDVSGIPYDVEDAPSHLETPALQAYVTAKGYLMDSRSHRAGIHPRDWTETAWLER